MEPIRPGKPENSGETSGEALLKGLYAAYAEAAGTRRVACGPGCHACCMDRVFMTTLEGRYLAQGLWRQGREDLLARAAGLAGSCQARPASTFNALARLCLDHIEPPLEPLPSAVCGPCPLLTGGLCAVYEHRPLACRAMASLSPCRAGGEAVEDPFWLTANAVFFQLVEQADKGGGFGPLPAVLARVSGGRGPDLLACEDLPGFLIPPEHQGRLRQMLKKALGRRVGDMSLGQGLAELRKSAGHTAGRIVV